jgi:hypothetical protein
MSPLSVTKNMSIKLEIKEIAEYVPVELDTAAKVRPQKLFSAKTIFAWF